MNKKKTTIMRQKEQYLNKEIVSAFHRLCVHGTYKLIGSRSIRNLLYANDYDLNESFHVKDSDSVFQNLHNHFKQIFVKAKNDPDYFILDFKCGIDKNSEPLRWSYDDVMQGFKSVNSYKYHFSDCLRMDATIKLDLCLVVNGLFNEITNNYFIYIGNNHESIDKQSSKKLKTMIDDRIKEVDELYDSHQYFKCLKRLFSLEVIENNVNLDLLNFLNSDYGLLYKSIHDLQLVLSMAEQQFKPVCHKCLIGNLEQIKQNTSLITYFDVEKILNDINKLSNKFNVVELQNLIDYAEHYLNGLVKPYLDKFRDE